MSDHHLHMHSEPDGGEHPDSDTTGIHGMLLFGDEEALYLSHLPMFVSPHNFQVILEVQFDDTVRDTFLSDRQAAANDIHTFVPEPFPIIELQDQGSGTPPRTSIRGTLFRGHFERGGQPIARDIIAMVQHVVSFVELDINEQRGEEWNLSYFCFGHPGHLYLAHTIKARPDFDHIVSVRMVSGTVTNPMGNLTGADVSTIGYDHAQPVQFGERSDIPRAMLAPAEITTASFFGSLGPEPVVSHGYFVQIEIVFNLYLETGDLA